VTSGPRLPTRIAPEMEPVAPLSERTQDPLDLGTRTIRAQAAPARKRLHQTHQRTTPSAAITAHASAGVSAWSHVGGPAGVRNRRDE
jgi:hypothetical protein